MNDQTVVIPEYVPGSALPHYVERLDDVEWVTDRRRPRTVAWMLALVAIWAGVLLVLIGLIIGMDDRPPADLFPTNIPTPAVSPHAAVPDSGVRPPAVKVVLS